MALTELPAWVESLGVIGLLGLGIWGFVRVRVMPRTVHDEIVAIYKEGAETDAATIKQLTADVSRLTTAMDKMVNAQQETLDSVRQLIPSMNTRRPE